MHDQHVEPPAENLGQKLQELRAVLRQYGVRQPEAVADIAALMEHRGLFSAPELARGTTVRALARAARAVTSPAGRRWILAGSHQTVRGRVIIPISLHKGRRPEREVTYAAQLLDRYLEQECRMLEHRRHHCIADLLNVSHTAGKHTWDSVRKRLARERPLSENDYRLAIWQARAQRTPDTPFPTGTTRVRISFVLEAAPDGQILWQWLDWFPGAERCQAVGASVEAAVHMYRRWRKRPAELVVAIDVEPERVLPAGSLPSWRRGIFA